MASFIEKIQYTSFLLAVMIIMESRHVIYGLHDKINSHHRKIESQVRGMTKQPKIKRNLKYLKMKQLQTA